MTKEVNLEQVGLHANKLWNEHVSIEKVIRQLGEIGILARESNDEKMFLLISRANHDLSVISTNLQATFRTIRASLNQPQREDS